jgi:FtsP/CotA-like multicopper oxidase with cupredoxin domain
MRVSRRALLMGAGAAVAVGTTLPLRRSVAEPETKEYRLTAQPATVNLTGDGCPDTAVWAYEGTVPGPELRMRRGQPVLITVINKLGEDTTVHWHGIRLPNAMDGAPNRLRSRANLWSPSRSAVGGSGLREGRTH